MFTLCCVQVIGLNDCLDCYEELHGVFKEKLGVYRPAKDPHGRLLRFMTEIKSLRELSEAIFFIPGN